MSDIWHMISTALGLEEGISRPPPLEHNKLCVTTHHIVPRLLLFYVLLLLSLRCVTV